MPKKKKWRVAAAAVSVPSDLTYPEETRARVPRREESGSPRASRSLPVPSSAAWRGFRMTTRSCPSTARRAAWGAAGGQRERACVSARRDSLKRIATGRAWKGNARARKSRLIVTQFSFLGLFFPRPLFFFFNKHVWFIIEKLICGAKEQQKEFLEFSVGLETISWFLEEQPRVLRLGDAPCKTLATAGKTCAHSSPGKEGPIPTGATTKGD